MKQTLIWFNLKRDGTRNGLPNIKETFSECLLLQMSATNSSPTYEHLPVFKACLSISCDGWEKCKEKVPNVSDANQTVETGSHSKLKFT